MILNALLFLLAILKFIFFLILAIIGIILLIVLILCALILFTPIKHNIVFRFKKDYIYLHFKVFVIRKIKVDIFYKNKKLEIKTSFDKKEDDKREQKKKKLSKNPTKTKRNNETSKALSRNKTLPEKEVHSELNTEQNSQYKSEKSTETKTEGTTRVTQEQSQGVNSEKTDDSYSNSKSSTERSINSSNEPKGSKKSKHNSKGSDNKSKTSTTPRKEKQKIKRDLNDWILFIQDNIEKAIWFLECYGTEKIFKWIKKSIKGVFSIFHLDATVFDGTFGKSNDPKLVGQSLGLFYTLKGMLYLKNFNLIGNFKEDIIDITFYSKGKIQLYKIVFPIIALGYFVALASIKAFKIDFKFIVNLIKNKLKSKKTTQ
ncbi:MAG: hypothetical protein ACK5LY_03755 [Lachnospirales bacterium]